jgi:hypothetical protein
MSMNAGSMMYAAPRDEDMQIQTPALILGQVRGWLNARILCFRGIGKNLAIW